MNKQLKLTHPLRSVLKKPFGKLLQDVRDIKAGSQMLICVGDSVSEKALLAGFRPKIIVYDGKIKRKDIEIPSIVKEHRAEELRVSNPAGYLMPEVFSALEEAFSSDTEYKIFVDGEEDLVSLAAIELAPEHSVVIYGQPDEGFVAVEVDEVKKKQVKDIMEQMIDDEC